MTSTAPRPLAVIRIDALLDVARMQEPVRRAAGNGGVLRSAHLLDHKPGRRALVAYRGDGPELYGKAYADPAAAARSFEVLQQCHQLFADVPGLRVPRPLALVPELAMLLYEPMSGRSLDEFVGTDSMAVGLQSAGRWLAALHGGDLRLDRALDVPHEAANAAQWAAVVGGSDPDVAARASALSDALLAEALPAPPRAVPIHKDFHYQHVIVDQDVGVVDLDEARIGDPSFDLAHFAVNLRLLGLRTASSAGEADGWLRSFLVAYAADAEWAPDRAFGWFAAYTCLKVSRQLATGSGPRPRPSGAARREQVMAILDEGLACLRA